MLRVFTILLFTFGLKAYAVDSGHLAPNFKLPGLQNTPGAQFVSLSDYKGKVVYLDFWASWCGPCRVSLPILNELREEYGPKGFEVLAVNIDEDQLAAVDFLSKYSVSYPILADPEGSVPAVYQPKGMPTAYLIDKEGRVNFVHSGFKKKDVAKIRSHIEKLLAK